MASGREEDSRIERWKMSSSKPQPRHSAGRLRMTASSKARKIRYLWVRSCRMSLGRLETDSHRRVKRVAGRVGNPPSSCSIMSDPAAGDRTCLKKRYRVVKFLRNCWNSPIVGAFLTLRSSGSMGQNPPKLNRLQEISPPTKVQLYTARTMAYTENSLKKFQTHARDHP